MENILINGTLELIEQDTDEAFASVSLNPLYQWVKIVVCDDKPNLNKQRIPSEEFENIIKTGFSSPIKMAEGHISDGHAEAHGKPIGAISHLKKENNEVKAIGALWKRERPEEIAQLKEMYASGQLPQVSWEIAYTDTDYDEDGVQNLRGVILNGLAIVGLPAYSGRTPIYEMASQKTTTEENTNVDELEQVKQELESLKAQLIERDNKIAELESQNQALSEYKTNIEEEKKLQERMSSIKNKFKEAGIDKDESYFEDHKDKLLKLEDEEIDFMVQELVSFKSTQNVESSVVVPPINDKPARKLSDPKELAKALKELHKK